MSIKNAMRRAARIFVELPDDSAAAPSAAAGPMSFGVSAPTPQPASPVDFQDIYRQAGISEAPLPAERIHDMLASLPANLDSETKRQLIGQMLTTLGKPEGATLQSIAADASTKIQALSAHLEKAQNEAAAWRVSAQSEIDNLEAQIEDKRKAIEASEQEQVDLAQQCRAESKRLNDVLEFFQPYVSAARSKP